MPGQRWNIYRTDGLDTDVVNHLNEILNFGGHVRFENCGALNEYKFLRTSHADMYM